MPKPKTLSPSQLSENAQPFKKWDKLVKRNANGQFERGSKALAGAGRPKGSKNRTTLQLREAILAALDRVGGEKYLARLAIENSSAFSSLLARVLPHTLTAASGSDGGPSTVMFTRVIVMPDGSRHIEGVTPKQLPAPASHTLPNLEPFAIERKEINDLED
jgi:hypothetical protein